MALPDTLLSRYRHVAAAVTGLAVACSLYYLYSSSNSPSSRPLQRSNARRRPLRSDTVSTVRPNQTTDGAHEPPDPVDSTQQLENATEYERDGEETEADMNEEETTVNIENGEALKVLIYHIAEDQNRQHTIIHRGIACDGCGMSPIRGIRWKCLNCRDCDFCSDCEANDPHNKTHLLVKIKIPAPFIDEWEPKDVAYPGGIGWDRNNHNFPTLIATLKKLGRDTKMERLQLEAYFEQFISIANTVWEEDPNGIKLAINRIAFDKTFFPQVSSGSSSGSNIVYDRMFHFWANNDNLIGFEDFVTKIERFQDTNQRLQLIFEAVDIDGDGYVSRKDFLHIFTVKYQIQSQLARRHLALSMSERQKRVRYANLDKPLNHILSTISEMGDSEPYERHTPAVGKRPDQFGETRHSLPLVADVPDEIDIGLLLKDMVPASLSTDEIISGQAQLGQDVELWLKTRREALETDEDESPPPTAENGSKADDEVYFSMNGYNLPAERSNSTKEILYQSMRDGMNELLDPMFVQREQLALEILRTKVERKKWRIEIDEYRVGKQPLPEVQSELSPKTNGNPGNRHSSNFYEKSSIGSRDDPIWPQFRPLNEQELGQQNRSTDSTQEQSRLSAPSESELKRYAHLGDEEEAGKGKLPVRLSFEEFKTLMDSGYVKHLQFMWSWFNVTSF
jgi:hypothetical protein